MENHEHIRKLFDKYISDDLTDAEFDQLLAYVDSAEADGALSRLIQAEVGRRDTAIDSQHIDELTGNVEKRLFAKTRPPKRFIGFRFVAIAASLLVSMTTAWFFLWPTKTEPIDYTSPRDGHATLTLADGTTVELSSEHGGIVVKDGITYPDGSLVMDNEELNMENERPALNSITTPKGGTYSVTLPDGSTVRLNAASTITYPNRFDAHQRKILLEGEAFFDIRPAPEGNVPFVVATKGQEVTVLGTTFNIAAYPDDDAKTTLLTGSVKVESTSENRASVTLRPGEQAVLAAGTFTKRAVALADEVAWLDNRFSFQDKTLEEVLKEVGRWYDLQIHYDGAAPQTIFYGGAPREARLSTILQLLESAEITFDVLEGRRLVITDRRGSDSP